MNRTSFNLPDALQVLLVLWGAIGMAGPARSDESRGAVSFSREIQPILARNCYACHGPDEQDRQADLRLDVRPSDGEGTGPRAIVPGKPEESELVRRIEADEDFERMPPPEAHESLTDAEKELLRRWIAEGAEYAPHWAFVPPEQTELPPVSDPDWPRNPIDHFILARLEEEGLRPSPKADRLTLIRRVSLDLIGLPPTPEEAEAFVNDSEPMAYERLVDRLLESPHYGERWARLWLDLARYSDTNGYEKDRPRSIWPYRDWVIQALNDDMPFDRFTVEQLAGDMLPDATLDQKIATGFHRNTMLNEEGGIDPLEFRYYAMVDRVATTGTVWLGLTVGCAQCHAHKYDLISHPDYFALMALLNNADEPDLVVPDPTIIQRRAEIESQIAELEAALPDRFRSAVGQRPTADGNAATNADPLERAFREWIDEQHSRVADWTVLRPVHMETNLPRLELLDDGSIFSTGDITKRDVFTLTFDLDGLDEPVTALRLEVLPDERLPGGGPGRAYYEGRKGDFFLSEVTASRNGNALPFSTASHSYGKISIGSGTAEAENVIDGEGSTGWSTAGREGQPHQLVLNFAAPVSPEGRHGPMVRSFRSALHRTPERQLHTNPARGLLVIEMLFERHFAASLGRFRISATTDADAQATELPVEIERLLVDRQNASAERDEGLGDSPLLRYFLSVIPELEEARQPIEELRKQLPELPVTMVMQERPEDNPRPTHRHHRGEYLNAEEEVSPGVPGLFPPLPEGEPADRLTFARWLVSQRNPLVGRVRVNHAWQAFFGTGLMEASDDFGTQSDPPSHPDLLDWLAVEFIERGFSQKQLHRLIVTSATYRQDSRLTPELLQRDPDNRLLARGPRLRLEAEMVRDSLLRASGLLSPKIGGPSVRPPQPASVTELAYGSPAWEPATSEDRYRRSLYTFSKRTAPFAAYAVFDAPSGETCTARREPSNTPLQALTLLNDEMFVEMAQTLAGSVRSDASERPEETATRIFRRLLTRPPTKDELAAVLEFHKSQRRRLESGELDAHVIVGDRQGRFVPLVRPTPLGNRRPSSPRSEQTARGGQADSDLAAWVMTARALMNLDEVVTKQ
jgi:hypothetical protein